MGHRLGQCFLKNKNQLKKAAQALDLKDGEILVEIGPGHGELTEFLIEKNIKLTLIEKDEALIPGLKEKFGNKIEIITGDALAELPNLKFGKKEFKITGNIPYYITGFLFRIIGELKNQPSTCVFTIQKEVAQRICAQKGDMNILAASIQIWANPKIISIVPKKDFSPIPKVDSAIIQLKSKEARVDLDKYFMAIKAIFKQPRKTILNNLVDYLGKENKGKIEEFLEQNNFKSSIRPQNLDISDIIKLIEAFN